MAEGVRDEININKFNLDVCELCGQKDNLKVCARCRSVSYCSRDHQVKHWPIHKVTCRKICAAASSPATKTDGARIGLYGINRGVKVNPVIEGVDKLSIYNCGGNRTSASDLRVKGGHKTAHRESYSMDQCSCFDDSVEPSGVHDQYGVAFGGGSDILEELSNLGAISHPSSSFTSSHTDIPQTPPREILSGSSESYILETEDSTLKGSIYSGVQTSTSMPTSSNKETYYSVLQSRIKALSQYAVKCLTAYGVCVIDNFLGEAKGTEILSEVIDLHDAGALSRGQLVNASSPNAAIRGDIITWIDGSEYGCTNINVLISSIDAIMIQCQRRLGKIISGRTKVRLLFSVFCRIFIC